MSHDGGLGYAGVEKKRGAAAADGVCGNAGFENAGFAAAAFEISVENFVGLRIHGSGRGAKATLEAENVADRATGA